MGRGSSGWKSNPATDFCGPAYTCSWQRIAQHSRWKAEYDCALSPQPDHQANSNRRQFGQRRNRERETDGSESGNDSGSCDLHRRRGCGVLDLSRGNAYRYVREGVIPAKRVGRRWMVPRKTFHAWLESCEAEPV